MKTIKEYSEAALARLNRNKPLNQPKPTKGNKSKAMIPKRPQGKGK